ncbi:MAG: TIGR03986 family CRISPR-associated RAMP protein [Propioniciclava sp.]
MFVNPYTFMSFPTAVERRPPLGHRFDRAVAAERYTGKLTVTWQLKSPLAVPADGAWGLGCSDDPDLENQPLTGQLRIPGASAKGAVRSLHEALFAGCARVIDGGYTPVYRDLMTSSLQTGWTLGVVVSPDADITAAGHPEVKIMPCSTPVSWVRAPAIATAAGQLLPRTGDFIEPKQPLSDKHRDHTFGQANQLCRVERGKDWSKQAAQNIKKGLSVILVTDTRARSDKQPYYWATARPDPQALQRVSEEALDRFRQRLRGADTASDPAPIFEDVYWPPNPTTGTAVAQRRSVDGHFRQGDVLWIKQSGTGAIEDIKLSLGWRTPARGPRNTLASRIPETVHPCQHLDEKLCLSCTVFGSIDADGESRGTGQQDAYGGHVRFGDIVGECREGRRAVALAPLSSPHPGAGMFYLTPISSEAMAKEMHRPDLPSRWDSQAGESNGSRNLRGRKFYWHSDPSQQQDAKKLPHPRYEARRGVTNQEILTKAHIVEQAELTQTVTFDGLDAVALASLLATLTPALVLGESGDFALRLGRGKPLGLGSVQAKVKLKMTTVAVRYDKGPEVLTELPDLTEVLKNQIPARCGNLKTIHEEAAKVLDIGGLGARAVDVSYPTTQPWGSYDTDDFHRGYTFFEEHQGKVTKKDKILTRGPWAPLPKIPEEQGQG